MSRGKCPRQYMSGGYMSGGYVLEPVEGEMEYS